MSISFPGDVDHEILEAMKRLDDLGVMVFAAAGNYEETPFPEDPMLPAILESQNLENFLVVGNLENVDTINTDSLKARLFAPGTDVLAASSEQEEYTLVDATGTSLQVRW